MGEAPDARSDRELVREAQNGNAQAFEVLVARYERKVYGLAYHLCGDAEDAADVAQEAFLKAFSSLRGFRGQSSFSTWLYRVTANVCFDALRSRRRRKTVSLDRPAPGLAPGGMWQVPDTSGDPAELVERQEVRTAVRRAIGRLHPDHRMVVVLRDLHGLSYEEIAQVLGLKEGTVKSRINRARLALRDHLIAAELIATGAVSRSDREAKGAAEGGDSR